MKLSGVSVTFDAGRKQLTRKTVVRFRRAGTKTVKLRLLRGTIKNIKWLWPDPVHRSTPCESPGLACVEYRS